MASMVDGEDNNDSMLDSLTEAKNKAENANELKEMGNAYFMAKDLGSALQCYTQAIELDPTNHIFYSNRAMVSAAMGEPEDALIDSEKCIAINPEFLKGYFHKANAEIELGRYGEASMTIMTGMSFEEGQREIDYSPSEKAKRPKSNFDRLSKLLKKRKQERMENNKEDDTHNSSSTSGSMASKDGQKKQSIKNFTMGEELGVGNFSRIVVATQKDNNVKYALKMIEKAEVDRMKKRHPNIHNEISMEKRVLAKLTGFPGIVTMYSTFQDYYCLYYQMEFLTCGELWSKLSDSQGHLVGADASLASRWVAEMVLAIEYIHSKGIIHRDLKPENVMVTNEGHIKIIDFGTAKDMVETDLNGPEFVGTPEYMAPEMVIGGGLTANYSVDLWALGVITYQLLLGFTAFKSASPYLTFLLIKRCHLSYPRALTAVQVDFISKLLSRDPSTRLGFPDMIPGNLYSLKRHAFFDGIFHHEENSNETMLKDKASLTEPEKEVKKEMNKKFNDNPKNRLFEQLPVKVPTLSELCVKALAHKMIASKTRDKQVLSFLGNDTNSSNEKEGEEDIRGGGGRKEEDNKLHSMFRKEAKERNLYSLYRLMHRLERMCKMNEPRILRAFFHNTSDFRCLRARQDRKDYMGLTHFEEGKWKEPFLFVHINCSEFLSNFVKSNDLNLESNNTIDGDLNEKNDDMKDALHEKTVTQLKALVSCLNRLRPKMCVLSGDFTNLPEAVMDIFRSQISRVSESIPLSFVAASSTSSSPSSSASASSPTSSPLPATSYSSSLYSKKFGSSFYGFWYGGMRALVLDSSLIMDHNVGQSSSSSSSLEEQQRRLDQEEWFDGEVEQGQLGGHHVVVFSYHPWFVKDPLEEDEVTTLIEEGNTTATSAGGGGGGGGEVSSSAVPAIPKRARAKWLRKFYDGKVRALFTSSSNQTIENQTSSSKLQTKNDGGTTYVLKGKKFQQVLQQAKDEEPAVEQDEDANEFEDRPIECISTSFNNSQQEFGIRIVSVFEHHITHKFFTLDKIPDRLELLEDKTK